MSSLVRTAQRALVIGSSGGIAKALVSALLDDLSIDFVYTVSRSNQSVNNARIKHYQVNSVNES